MLAPLTEKLAPSTAWCFCAVHTCAHKLQGNSCYAHHSGGHQSCTWWCPSWENNMWRIQSPIFPYIGNLPAARFADFWEEVERKLPPQAESLISKIVVLVPQDLSLQWKCHPEKLYWKHGFQCLTLITISINPQKQSLGREQRSFISSIVFV